LDYSKAFDWYRKAAVKGDLKAENNIAHLYKAGLGVQQDYSEALKWYQKAADQGDDWAQKAIDNLKKEMAK
jgi:TPR repeat protein